MIPLRLASELKKRFEKLFEDKQYRRALKDDESPDEKHYMPIRIFLQNLPIKKAADDEYAPFLLIQLHRGTQAKSGDKSIVDVTILVGMFDETSEVGYQDVAQTLNQIIDDLKKYPVIDNTFELDLDAAIDWEIAEEDTYPYYFGGVNIHFTTPIFNFGKRQDLEGLI